VNQRLEEEKHLAHDTHFVGNGVNGTGISGKGFAIVREMILSNGQMRSAVGALVDGSFVHPSSQSLLGRFQFHAHNSKLRFALLRFVVLLFVVGYSPS
jgi:hypothetical protein